MAKTFSDYHTVRDNDSVLFDNKVKAKLKEGWLCRGKMKTGSGGDRYSYDYLQNMVKP